MTVAAGSAEAWEAEFEKLIQEGRYAELLYE